MSPFPTTPQPTPRLETRYRRITTPIPSPGAVAVLERLARVENRAMHGQLPVLWRRAEGFQVEDGEGNRWIDFTSSIFVANAGHAPPAVAEALARQLSDGPWHTYTYASEIRAEYLERLIALAPSPLGKAWLSTSGSEATECALRIAKLHGGAAGKRRAGIVTFDGAYHGRTIGAALMSGTEATRAWMGLNDPTMVRLPFPYPWTLNGKTGAERAAADLDRLAAGGVDLARDIAAIMLETYQGWAAAFYPPGYVETLAEAARKAGALVMFDDIQAGFGRTGRLFGFQHYDVAPDVVALGKGISSSLPLAATLARPDLMDLFQTGSMAATHSAHPLCCAAGLANLQALEQGDLVAQSVRRGALMHERLAALQRRHPDRISHVLGHGLIAAILFRTPGTDAADPHTPTRACFEALRRGLILVHTGRESIKIAPPLVIEDDALLEGLDALEDAITAAVD